MEHLKRDHFTFFRSFLEQIELLPEHDQLRLLKAIVYYALDQKDTTFDEPLMKMAWIGIKPHLYKAWVKFLNGSNGGAPQGNNNALKQPKNNRKTTKKQAIGKDRIGEEEDNNILLDTKLDTKKQKQNVLPDYISPEFVDIMTDWIGYKKERGEAYKPRGIKYCYSRLLNLSGSDPMKARRIVEQSIANNYSGLFQIKDNNNESNFRNTAASNIAAAQQAHYRSIAESISTAEDRSGEVFGYLSEH